MTVIINLFGSSGSGKSTTALGLVYQLKLLGYKVELVSEWIKEQIMAKNFSVIEDQLYIFTKQRKKQRILIGKSLDFIVTDSPLLLSSFYGEKYNTVTPTMNKLFLEEFSSFKNLNFFLERTVPFDTVGRFETEEQSDADSVEMRLFLQKLNTEYSLIEDSEKLPEILKILKSKGNIYV